MAFEYPNEPGERPDEREIDDGGGGEHLDVAKGRGGD